MSKTKIYLNDGTEEYIVQKDKFGVPYVTFDEVIDSLNMDERYDDSLKLVKEFIDDMSKNPYDDRIGYVTINALEALVKNVDDPAVKKIAAGLSLILKDIYY